jgi:hypothetical protein
MAKVSNKNPEDGKSGHQEIRYIERGGATHKRAERKSAEAKGRHSPPDAAKRWATTAHLTTV